MQFTDKKNVEIFEKLIHFIYLESIENSKVPSQQRAAASLPG